MKKKDTTEVLDKPLEKEKTGNFPGYPLYPASEDIYNKFRKDESVDPEDASQDTESVGKGKVHTRNEKDFDDDVSEIDDLDVPGSELDDEQEDIGSEDEENNYYSLGGDNHEDLEENRGE